jgi:hypothetical protein
LLRIESAELSLVRNERYEPEQVLIVNTTAGVQEAEIVKNLSVVVLPKDLPPIQKQEGKKDYKWEEWSRSRQDRAGNPGTFDTCEVEIPAAGP